MMAKCMKSASKMDFEKLTIGRGFTTMGKTLRVGRWASPGLTERQSKFQRFNFEIPLHRLKVEFFWN